MRIASAGRAVFAVTLIGFGILGVVQHNFGVVWEPLPERLAGAAALRYLCDFISIACGAGLLWGRTAALAARVLLAYLLLWLVVFRIPGLFRSLAVDIYWSACQTAVLVGAAWVLYVWSATEWDRRRLSFATGDRGLRIARDFYGVAMIPFGISHFQYAAYTASLIPHWIPAHMAWVYATGSAFIAAGIAILINVSGCWAAALSALQMGLFLLIVWVPVVAKGAANDFQWGETLVSWLLAVAGWVVADSYRGKAVASS